MNNIQLYNGSKDNVGKPITIDDAIYLLMRDEKLKAQIFSLRTMYAEWQEALDLGADTKTAQALEEKYSEAKKKLPAVTWSGTFTKRNAKSLLQYNGMICIDIDKVPNIDKLFKKLSKDAYTALMFVSPSGTGIKVLVMVAGTADQHKEYFLALEQYYKQKYGIAIDASGKDVCRLCYLSNVRADEGRYKDNEIHIGLNHAETFTYELMQQYTPVEEKQPAPKKAAKIKTVPVPASDDTPNVVDIDDFLKVGDIWDSTNKHTPYQSGNRNNMLHKFACNSNRVGIDINDCINFALSAASDLPTDEINATINSAYNQNANEHGKYKKGANGGTGATKPSKPTKGKSTGSNGGAAPARPTGTDGGNGQQPQGTGTKPAQNETLTFWREHSYTKGKGEKQYEVIRLELNRVAFRRWLYVQGFHLLQTGDSKSDYEIVYSSNGVVTPITPQMIKHYCINWCESKELEDVNEMLSKGQKNYFSMTELDSLPYKKIELHRDNQETTSFFFRNCFVCVNADGSITTHPYSDLKTYIWEANKIQHDFELDDIFKLVNNKPIEINCEFSKFISLASHNPNCEEEKGFSSQIIADRFFSFCSTIGFLLDGYKHPAERKGIFAIDHKIAEKGEQNGRTGKSLIPAACEMLKKVATINGKSYDPKYQFRFEPITIDSQIINFNDMRAGFDPQDVFELIADNYAVNRRNQGYIYFKYHTSPKVYVSSNFVPQGEGSSFTGRMHIIEFSDYFTPTHTPYNEFGHAMFSDWDTEEKNRFFNFMLQCVSLYKREGLIDYPMPNYDKRKLISQVVTEFIDFMDQPENMPLGQAVKKIDILTKFNDTVYLPLYSKKLSPHNFSKWVKQYAKNKGLLFNPDKNGGYDKRNGEEYYTLAMAATQTKLL